MNVWSFSALQNLAEHHTELGTPTDSDSLCINWQVKINYDWRIMAMLLLLRQASNICIDADLMTSDAFISKTLA
jgi:hypothetical protein